MLSDRMDSEQLRPASPQESPTRPPFGEPLPPITAAPAAEPGEATVLGVLGTTLGEALGAALGTAVGATEVVVELASLTGVAGGGT